jgi:hypothetical protein
VSADLRDYVEDGSIIRSALEVNAFLTISALTERIVENIVGSLGN